MRGREGKREGVRKREIRKSKREREEAKEGNEEGVEERGKRKSREIKQENTKESKLQRAIK